MPVLEPKIRPNFNMCSVYGAGDLNSQSTVMRGSFGHGFIEKAAVAVGPAIAHTNFASPTRNTNSGLGIRGFYNQEFTPQTRQQVISNDYQCSLRDASSPESVVSSSSPEMDMFESEHRWSRMRVILDSEDEAAAEREKAFSPIVPILAPVPLKDGQVYETGAQVATRLAAEAAAKAESEAVGGDVSPSRSDSDSEKDKENTPALKSRSGGFGGAGQQLPLRDAGNVAVTLTLSSDGDIKRILGGLAKILGIEPPTDYQIVERTETPPSEKLGLYSAESEVKIDQFCRFCEIVVMPETGVRKKVSEMPPAAQLEDEGPDEDVLFCSTSCYMQFAMFDKPVVAPIGDKAASGMVSHRSSTDTNMTDRQLLPPMSPMMEDDDSRLKTPDRRLSTASLDDESLLALPTSSYELCRAKKWKEKRYKYWTPSTFEPLNPKGTQSNIKLEPL